MDETKRCGHCRLVKPLDAFYRDIGKPDGREWQCRACRVRHPTSGPKGEKQPPLPTSQRRPPLRCRRCQMRLLGPGFSESGHTMLELSCVFCGEYYYYRDH